LEGVHKSCLLITSIEKCALGRWEHLYPTIRLGIQLGALLLLPYCSMLSRSVVSIGLLVFLSFSTLLWLTKPLHTPVSQRQVLKMGIVHIVMFEFKPGTSSAAVKDVCNFSFLAILT
jgi:hypothetical protein